MAFAEVLAPSEVVAILVIESPENQIDDESPKVCLIELLPSSLSPEQPLLVDNKRRRLRDTKPQRAS